MRADEQPVLIGVGQQTWREQGSAGTPADALQTVAQRALDDSRSHDVRNAIDAIVHVPFILNQVDALRDAMPSNMGTALAQRLGISASQYSADVGGNLPQHLVNAMAGRLVRGEHSVVLLCGVELLATFLGAVRGGAGFPEWDSGSGGAPLSLVQTPGMTTPTEQAHGLFEPTNAYPLFESALRHAKGLAVEAHAERLGRLISTLSEVAVANPYAWKPRRYATNEVLSTDNRNRMICHPYTKVMNSIIAVDQAAAVIMTTARRARELGVDASRCIYLRGGAGAHDTWYLSERQDLHRSPALGVAARAALQQAGLGIDEMDCFDIYSCFPSAIQIACDEIGIAIDDERGLTVTGGMSLFGGPGNNYSLHALVSLVERLRELPGGKGLLSANGGYLTKHAVGVYAREPGDSPWQPLDEAPLQAQVDALPTRDVADEGSGVLTVEAHTVKYKGESPDEALLLGQLNDGKRCVAVSRDEAVIEAFLRDDCVGLVGTVEHRAGQNHFQL